MASEERARRVAERITEEVADILLKDVEDQRLSGISIVDVQVDREFAFATISVSSYLTDIEDEEILKALEGARGFLRSKLASRISLRSFPQLRFRMDSTSEKGARIDDLLASIRREDNQQPEDEGED